MTQKIKTVKELWTLDKQQLITHIISLRGSKQRISNLNGIKSKEISYLKRQFEKINERISKVLEPYHSGKK